jgi:predicted DNA-binding protein with PD1-like motif
MKATQLAGGTQPTWALIFDKNDEVVKELTAFAKVQNLAAAHFTAIGAFSEVTLGYFDREQKDYVRIPVREQVEVLSLVGDVARQDGEPKIHAHVVVGKRDGTAHGGHLLEAHVRPTLEVIVAESPRHLERRTDERTGLPLLKVD